MKIEQSLHFWVQHNEAIIQWLIVGILVITALWLVRMLTDKPKADSAAPKVDLSEIEANLKKLLERASAIEATPASPTLEQAFAKTTAGGGAAPDPALKAELEKREKEISALKAQLTSAPKADVSQFTSKITELETKLAEYEILEDDIADLSLYKEENVRLKDELTKLKGGDASTPAAAPAEAPKEENLVAEFEEAVKQEKAVPPPEVAPAPVAAAPEPTPAPPQPVAATPPESAPQPAATAPASAAKAAPAPEGDADDILAEFAGEGLDTDKMLAEIETLNQAGEADSSALEEASDINKMAEEASKLGT